MAYSFSTRSRRNLQSVHPHLRQIAERALQLTTVDFVVIEGLRTIERQRKLVRSGASRTLKSKHLTGHAIDVAAYVDGQIRWDWPLYPKIAKAFKAAAAELDMRITWGGDWHRLRDGPHFELNPLAHPWPQDA